MSMDRTRYQSALTFLARNWLLMVIFVGIGLLTGLAVRLPLLPSPNAFTTSLWTAIGGAAVGAGVTVAGTLHVTRTLRNDDAKVAVHSVLDLLYLLLSGLTDLESASDLLIATS
jgi:hypothetical protein